jgi:protein-tyrosine phosphatase
VIKSSGSLLVQVTKNDGQKQTFKPVVIKSSDWTTFLKSACNKINAKYTPKARVFTIRGEEIKKVEDLEPNLQIVVSEKGSDFIPMALKMTAAERREAKMKKAMDQTSEILQAITTDNSNNNNNNYHNKQKDHSRGLEKMTLGISEILEGFLYLGNVRDARSEEQLKDFQISHILNMSNDVSNSTFEFINYKRVPIADDEYQNIAPYLDNCIDFINLAKDANNGRVLVHCTKGKSRSATVIIAYLVKCYKMPLKEAYRLVKMKRDQIQPNSNFVRQLMDLERQLNGEGMYL